MTGPESRPVGNSAGPLFDAYARADHDAVCRVADQCPPRELAAGLAWFHASLRLGDAKQAVRVFHELDATTAEHERALFEVGTGLRRRVPSPLSGFLRHVHARSFGQERGPVPRDGPWEAFRWAESMNARNSTGPEQAHVDRLLDELDALEPRLVRSEALHKIARHDAKIAYRVHRSWARDSTGERSTGPWRATRLAALQAYGQRDLATVTASLRFMDGLSAARGWNELEEIARSTLVHPDLLSEAQALEARRHLADALLHTAREAEALDHYEAIRRTRGSAGLEDAMGQAMLAAGAFDQAKDWLRTHMPSAIERPVAHATWRRRLAQAHAAQGERDLARLELQSALRRVLDVRDACQGSRYFEVCLYEQAVGAGLEDLAQDVWRASGVPIPQVVKPIM